MPREAGHHRAAGSLWCLKWGPSPCLGHWAPWCVALSTSPFVHWQSGVHMLIFQETPPGLTPPGTQHMEPGHGSASPYSVDYSTRL